MNNDSPAKTSKSVQGTLAEWRRWLRPGLGIKRWLVALLLAITLLGVAFTFLIVEIYQGGWLPAPLYALSLQWLPRPLRGGLLMALALPLLWYGLSGLQKNFFQPLQPIQAQALQLVSRNRKLANGPRIVVIGGGTGMATLLRGLKKYTTNLTAIVTVADDGGSSGRLRQSLGVLPPGDFRNCLAAMADDEAFITQLFQYRFGGAEDVGGHSFGNLFLTAMSGVTGSFEEALVEAGKVLAIQGQVLPSTLEDVTLCAEIRPRAGGRLVRVRGESQIPETDGTIQRVYLDVENVRAYPAAIQAILSAELIVAGPGSLFTSILPNLLVADISAAVQASSAVRVLVVNTATQPGETEGFSVLDHINVVERHTQQGIFPLVLANNNYAGSLHPNLQWVQHDSSANGEWEIVFADVVDKERPWRHDSDKLAQELIRLFELY